MTVRSRVAPVRPALAVVPGTNSAACSVTGYGTGGVGSAATVGDAFRQTWTTKATGGGGSLTHDGQRVPVSPGQLVTGTVWSRHSHALVSCVFRLFWMDASGTQVGTADTLPFVPTANVWERRVLSATAPSGAVSMRVELRIQDFSLETAATAPIWQEAREFAVYLDTPVLPASGVSFRDAFDRANGALGSSWTTPRGTWQVLSGTAASSTAVADNIAMVAASTWGGRSDYTVSANILSINDNGAMLLARMQDADNFYALRCTPVSGSLDVFKRVAGTFTSIGSVGLAYAPGDRVALQVSGSTIRTFRNGVAGATFTDATFASGGAGIRTDTNNVPLWDNFVVE